MPKFGGYEVNITNTLMSNPNLSSFTYQPTLRPALPSIYGPQEYRDQAAEYQNLDAMLRSGLEHTFILQLATRSSTDWSAASPAERNQFAKRASLCLRCNLAKSLTGLSFRALSVATADSTLLNWFISGPSFGTPAAPAKSTFQRYSDMAGADLLAEINTALIRLASTPATLNPDTGSIDQPFDLTEAISLANLYFDGTCLKTNIHFPTDWILLRDAVRTLMKGTLLIRRAGLRGRMPQTPEAFLRAINQCCIAMSQSRRRQDSKRQRKAILREMKQLVKTVAAHARTHLALLVDFRAALPDSGKPAPNASTGTNTNTSASANKNHNASADPNTGNAPRSATPLTEARALVIEKRLQNVLDQLPAATRQAHERLIGGRPVANKEKIFSLYEPDVNCLVRGKASAEVEFGNKLWLGETESGLIVHYQLLRENQDDSALLVPSVKQLLEQHPEGSLKTITGDRGTHSAANDKALAALALESHLCPRGVDAMAARRANDPAFRQAQKRRGGTEARIAILKNVFLDGLVRSKGHQHREQSVGWAVLTHNLVVLSDRLQAQRAEEKEAARKAAQKAGQEAAPPTLPPRQRRPAA